MKNKFIYLWVALQRGRVYIGMITFMGTIELLIRMIPNWDHSMYIIIIPVFILFMILIGLLDMKFILNGDAKFRNPYNEKIINNQLKIIKNQENILNKLNETVLDSSPD